MRYFDGAETDARGDGRHRAETPRGSEADEQRHRLHIYRAALVRLRAERAAGTPPARAAWQVAQEINDLFALDRQHCALLVHCLVAELHEA